MKKKSVTKGITKEAILETPTVVQVSTISDLLALKANSVTELACLHKLQFVSAGKRGQFMDEAHRVLKPSGKLTIIVPYYTSMRSVADFAHEWPPFCEMSFLYYNKEWRINNKVHPELKCDFDFTYGYQADPETATRSQDVQSFWVKHYTNSVLDLQVVMTKK